MANPDYGYCSCPVCKYARAAVRIAANNKAYISCDNCVSNIRTLSSIGDKDIRAMMTSRVDGLENNPAPKPGAGAGAEASPGAAAAAAPAPAGDKAKKQGGFADALDVLTGGKRG